MPNARIIWRSQPAVLVSKPLWYAWDVTDVMVGFKSLVWGPAFERLSHSPYFGGCMMNTFFPVCSETQGSNVDSPREKREATILYEAAALGHTSVMLLVMAVK